MGYPAANQVLAGVVFGASNELTGTLVLPDPANVKLGIGVGVAPAAGTLRVPLASQVRNGVSFGAADADTGTLSIPSANKVIAGWSYGAGGAEFIGEYQVALPTVHQVLFGVAFGSGQTGNVRLPAPEQVEYGVHFGPQSNSVGIFTGEGGSIPTTGDIVAALLDENLGNTRGAPGSVREALQAARADVFGDRTSIGAQLRYYAADKTTVLKTMNVNDIANPTVITDADGDPTP